MNPVKYDRNDKSQLASTYCTHINFRVYLLMRISKHIEIYT